MGDSYIVSHVDIDNIDIQYQINKYDIESGLVKHLKYISSRKDARSQYKTLIKTIKNIDNKYISQKGGKCNNSLKRRRYYIKPDGSYLYIGSQEYNMILNDQRGGNIGILLSLSAIGVLGTMPLAGLLAYIIYEIYNKEENCKITYPLYDRNKIPQIDMILEKILPNNWIKEGREKGKTLNNTIIEISTTLETITNALSIFSTTEGNIAEKTGKIVAKTAFSAIAALASGGTGGDKLVNIPILITNAVNMMAKIFNKLLSVINKLNKMLVEVQKTVDKVKHTVDKVKHTIDKVQKTVDKVEKKINNSKEDIEVQIQFIYDIFSVNFSDGPQHTVCWTNYIMKYYITNSNNIKRIYTLICLFNDIYNEVNESVIGFVGSAVDMIIPESMGLAGTLAPMLKQYSYKIYTEVRSKVTKNYNKISPKYQNLIQHPEKMSVYIFERLSAYSLGLSNKIISDTEKKEMGKYLDIVATCINKGFGIMYMFMNVFIIFSEINAGINKTLVTQDINADQIIKDCTFCGSIEPDTNNCERCKMFFLDDGENVLSEQEMLDKCNAYSIGRRRTNGLIKNSVNKLTDKLKRGDKISKLKPR